MKTSRKTPHSLYALLLAGAALLAACGDKTSTSTTPKPPASVATPVTPPAVTPPSAAAGVMKLDYEGFTVWLDCKRRGAIKFQYSAKKDIGS